MTPEKPKIRVGWNELADLDDWQVFDLPVKIDTGARSSSLHVEGLQRTEPGSVAFHIACPRSARARRVTAAVAREAYVTSSNGNRSKRIFVRTVLTLGGHSRPIEVNLVSRGDMHYPMLIGRSALAGVYIVDPARRRMTRRRRS